MKFLLLFELFLLHGDHLVIPLPVVVAIPHISSIDILCMEMFAFICVKLKLGSIYDNARGPKMAYFELQCFNFKQCGASLDFRYEA